MYIKPCFVAVLLLFIISCTTINPDITNNTAIDYKLYQGTWYEIARLPNPVEDGLICVTMTYEFQDEGVMTVVNKGQSKGDPGDIKTLSGRAWIPDGKEPEKIKIQFIWPITKDYVLLHIDETKGFAMLGSPFKHQLWILSRSSSIADEDYSELIKIAAKNQYNVENLVRVEQSCK